MSDLDRIARTAAAAARKAEAKGSQAVKAGLDTDGQGKTARVAKPDTTRRQDAAHRPGQAEERVGQTTARAPRHAAAKPCPHQRGVARCVVAVCGGSGHSGPLTVCFMWPASGERKGGKRGWKLLATDPPFPGPKFSIQRLRRYRRQDCPSCR